MPTVLHKERDSRTGGRTVEEVGAHLPHAVGRKDDQTERNGAVPIPGIDAKNAAPRIYYYKNLSVIGTL